MLGQLQQEPSNKRPYFLFRAILLKQEPLNQGLQIHSSIHWHMGPTSHSAITTIVPIDWDMGE